MRSKDGALIIAGSRQRANALSLHNFSRAIALTASGLGLLAAPLFIGATIYSVNSLKNLKILNESETVSVQPSAWAWMNDVHWALENPSPVTTALNTTDEIRVTQAAPKTIQSITHKIKHLAVRHVLRPAKKHDVAVATVAVKPAPPVALASEADLKAVQSMHSMLRHQFMMAMNTQIPVQQGTAIAQASLEAEKLDSQPKQQKPRRRLPKGSEDMALLATALPKQEEAKKTEKYPAVVTDSVATSHAAPIVVAQQTDPVPAAVAVAPEKVDTQTLHAEYSKPEAEEMKPLEPETPKEMAQAPPEYDDELDAPEETIAVTKPAPQPEAKPSFKSKVPALPMEVMAKKLWAEYSVDGASKTSPVQVSIPGAPAKAVSAPAVVASRVTTHQGLKDALADQTDDEYPADTVVAKAEKDNAEKATLDQIVTPLVPASAVEAFGPPNVVPGAVREQYTYEAAGWSMSQAHSHWPTLAREEGVSIPLISSNSVKLLGSLVAPIQEEAGIVFGKVPAGWSVRISGRAEHPIFFNDKDEVVPAQEIENARRFAFVNVGPGEHLLYMTNRLGAEEGAIGIPALGGVATFANLEKMKKVSVGGRVLDAGNANGAPIKGAMVRVLGSVAGQASTDGEGKFRIENVLTVGDHPIYLETEAPQAAKSEGYTHRYSFSPNELSNVTLYRMSTADVQVWLGQLEGTISPDSGLILAAIPNLIADEGPTGKLYPKLQPLTPSATLQPEVYPLSPEGQLKVDSPMDAQTTRFVGVQIPEGPSLLSFVDPAKQIRHSEIIVSSPGVINLVGPY